jgi:hypothetical protein
MVAGSEQLAGDLMSRTTHPVRQAEPLRVRLLLGQAKSLFSYPVLLAYRHPDELDCPQPVQYRELS